MALNDNKPLFVRIAGERQPNLLPATASAVGFDFNRDRFVFYHTASDDWADISPDGVDFVGSIYADNFFAAGVVTASLGFSGSLTQLADGTSYLIAGTNVTIVSESNGAITISSAGGGSGFPGGLNTYVQFNDAGTFGGDAGLTYDKNTDTLRGTVITASLGFSGSLTQLADGTSYLIAGNNISITSQSNGPVTIVGIHDSLRDLIHFIDQGPACGFGIEAYKEQGPAGAFPTQSVWYTDITKTNKIVELNIVWSGAVPLSQTWRSYASNGTTVNCTVTDAFTYANGIFESSRIRTIT
jgi:hypothetical protein